MSVITDAPQTRSSVTNPSNTHQILVQHAPTPHKPVHHHTQPDHDPRQSPKKLDGGFRVTPIPFN